MKLPTDTIIATAKLTQYLLVWRAKNDKSRWLARAGYTLENWGELEQDMRSQLLPLDATLDQTTPYGEMYEIRGTLTGPNGNSLATRSYWIHELATGLVKFVTIYPDREVTDNED